MSQLKGSYYVVQSFMTSELGLKGIDKEIFAIIWGFSQGNNTFNGSLSYLEELTGYSRPTVIGALKGLVCRGLLVKKEIFRNGQKLCVYKAVLPDNVRQGSKIGSNEDFDIVIEDESTFEQKPVKSAVKTLKTENKTSDSWFKPKTYQNKNDVNADGWKYGMSSDQDIENIQKCWETPKNTASKEEIAKMKQELLEKLDRVRAEKAKGVKTVKLSKGGK